MQLQLRLQRPQATHADTVEVPVVRDSVEIPHPQNIHADTAAAPAVRVSAEIPQSANPHADTVEAQAARDSAEIPVPAEVITIVEAITTEADITAEVITKITKPE